MTVSLKAHFNGSEIVLDEPVELPIGTPLLITVTSANLESEERAEWTALSLKSLARAYGPDEPEYTEADLKK